MFHSCKSKKNVLYYLRKINSENAVTKTVGIYDAVKRACAVG